VKWPQAIRVGQLTAIDQSEEAIAGKAAEGTPQPPIVEPRRAAGLSERTRPLQAGTNLLIARERILLGWRVTREEVQLERAELILWQVFLLPSPQRSTSSTRGGIYA
jgi:hypothetical protein